MIKINKRDMISLAKNLIPKYYEIKAVYRWRGYISKKCLDLGCGHGLYTKILYAQKNEIESVKIDLEGKTHPDVICNAEKLPFEKQTFNVVYSFQVLEHIRDIDKAIQEIRRVLKSDGKLLITVPMTWPHHYDPHDYRRFTKYGIISTLENYNFEINEISAMGGTYTTIAALIVNSVGRIVNKSISILNRKIGLVAELIVSIVLSTLLLIVCMPFYKLDNRLSIGWQVVATKK